MAHELGSQKKTWAELLAPAIDLAEKGFAVDVDFNKTIGWLEKRLSAYPASTALFLPNGAPPPVGSTWKDPELGAVLRRIAEQGPKGFYEGPRRGDPRPRRDEGERRPRHREPTSTTTAPAGARPSSTNIAAATSSGMPPPPSSGGVTMAMIAHILEGYDVRALGWHSPAHVHLVVEAMRRAFAARNAKLGDPDFVKNPDAELLSPEWAAKQRATIQKDKATPTADLFPALKGAHEGPNTTNFSVVDADGNAVALTTTLNAWYGCGATVPGLGFVLNDEMDDFASVPGTANGFGLVQGEPNAIAPGKRMLSSMSPSIVVGPGGRVEAVLRGGRRRFAASCTAVFQELSNLVDFQMDVGDAVRAPRFHQQDSPDVILLRAPRAPRGRREGAHGDGPRDQGDRAPRGRAGHRTRPRPSGRGRPSRGAKGGLAALGL